MRYDTPVYFRTEIKGEYDPATGNYADPTVQEEEKLASVMPTGESVMRLVYGGLKEGSVTVQLQNHYPGDFKNLRIGDLIYDVDRKMPLRTKDVFVVHEVK